MDELQQSASAVRGDEDYRSEWSYFYKERRRLLIRLVWLAIGLIVSALLLVNTQGDYHPPLVLRFTTAFSFGLFLVAILALWFFFVWEMRTWPCPKCAKRFFVSAFTFDPFFTRRCRNCESACNGAMANLTGISTIPQDVRSLLPESRYSLDFRDRVRNILGSFRIAFPMCISN
jgi:hypothetical protein